MSHEQSHVGPLSTKRLARIAGAFYLGELVTHVPGLLIRGHLVSYANAATTAANVLAHPQWLYLGFATDLLGFAWYVVVTALLYQLFSRTNRTISGLAALFSLGGCTIGALSSAFTLVPLVLGSPGPFAPAFGPDQLAALGLLFFRVYAVCFNTSFAFFGFYCVLIGYLAFRSTFAPRLVGILMVIAGLGWLTFLYPPLARALSPGVLLPGIIGEGGLTLWLLAGRVAEP